jgi:hypothetical protein
MDFQRGLDPKKALNIGWDRRLKKGDEFQLTVPAMGSCGLNPERIERAIATEDEESFICYTKSGRNSKLDGIDWYEIRQVKWKIPQVAQGIAEIRNDCEFPKWIFTTKSRIF